MIIDIENYRQENCLQCSQKGTKHGKSTNGIQRLYCRFCRKAWQISYVYNAYFDKTNPLIIGFIKEGCGIRSIARLLQISTTTLMRRIIKIAKTIKQPTLFMNKTYEADELCTYVKNKKNKIWIACAMEKEGKKVVRFFIGKRTNKTLRKVINDVLVSTPKQIVTDKLKNYEFLIPREIHKTFSKGIQNIERMNLNLRIHLKRLNRKTIAFSKSTSMLNAITKIYLWN